jgi:hypothetical protein
MTIRFAAFLIQLIGTTADFSREFNLGVSFTPRLVLV